VRWSVEAPECFIGRLPVSSDAELVADLHRYMDAFNRGDYASLVRFYAEDVVLVIASGHELVGRQAIIDFYRKATSKTRRTISIVQAFGSGDRLAAELESEFLAVEDFPEFSSGPMKKGDRLYVNTFVLYELRDGLYARIRSAPFKREWRRLEASA
jgi:hypothetical protein